MKLSNKIGIFSLIIAVIGILVTAEFRSLYYSNNDITNNSFSKLSGDKKPIAIYIKKAYEAVSNNKLTIPSKYSAIYYARILKKLYPKDKVSKKIAIDIVRKYILLSANSSYSR